MMVTEVSCVLFPMHVSAACVCTVPDVDASVLFPQGASSFKWVFKARSPPDKEKGSDTAGRHPALPLVKVSAVDAIIRARQGSFVGCLFRRVLEQVLRGRGLDGESIIDDGRGSRCPGRCA